MSDAEQAGADQRVASRASWDDRHAAASAPGAAEPSVIEMIPLMPRGWALDIAAGTGRNSLALARAGISVAAVDFSPVAMRALRETASASRLPIVPVVLPVISPVTLPVILPVIADLETALPFPDAVFDVILNVNYLDRRLVPRLRKALKVGGVLLFDTFLIDQAASGHPRDPRFMLDHYELRGLLAGMELIRYREGIVAYPGGKTAWRATALARRTS
jgi:SAM-dependent methyltransferase